LANKKVNKMPKKPEESSIIEDVANSTAFRLNHLIKVTAECNQSMIRLKSLPALMENICQIMVNKGGFNFAWIYLLPDSPVKNSSNGPQFQAGLTEADFQNFSRKVSVVLSDYIIEDSDVLNDNPLILSGTETSKNQKKLIPREIRKKNVTVIILRLYHLQKFLGLLTLYSTIENYFNNNIVEVLQELASNLSCGISGIKTKDELKATREALSESQSMLQLVMDTIPIRLFWKDKDFRYLGCNKAFALDAGLNSPEEIVGMNDFELSWKETAPLYRSDDTEIISKNISKVNYEEPQVRLDGKNLWLRTTKIPLQNNEGKIIGLFGSYEDITERKRAEEHLMESERRYKMATNAASVGVWDLNFRTQKMYIDPILKVLLGFEENEISNQLHSLIYEIFPEFAKTIGTSNKTGHKLLNDYATPEAIIDLGVEELIVKIRKYSRGKLGARKAIRLYNAAKNSIGIKEGAKSKVLHVRQILNQINQLNSDIEDVESGIPFLVALLVQVADHHRDVGFEEPVADDQTDQPEHEEGVAGNAHQKQAGGHEKPTEGHRPPISEVPVGDHPAEKRREIHEGEIQTVDFVALSPRQSEPPSFGVDGVEQEDPDHGVEREAFPHLGEEQR